MNKTGETYVSSVAAVNGNKKKLKNFKKVLDKVYFISYNTTRCVRESTAKTSKEVG